MDETNEITQEQLEAIQDIAEKISKTLIDVLEKLQCVFRKLINSLYVFLDNYITHTRREILYTKLVRYYVPYWIARFISNNAPRFLLPEFVV